MILQAALTWTATVGTIVSTGPATARYTAPRDASGVALVVASAGGKADTARVFFTSHEVLASLPFGYMTAPPQAIQGLTDFGLAPEHLGIVDALPEIAARGGRVMVNLTNSGNCAKDADGVFRFALWRECFDRNGWDNLATRQRITEAGDNGTLLALYILDEPNHASRWGPPGTIPPAMIESMACYAKSHWPRVKVVVRAAPDWLDDYPLPYECLDGTWAQYRRSRGTIGDYIARNQVGADALRLCLVFSLNILDGGDGSSGWDSGKGLWEMSPREILAYGLPMVKAQPWALGMWQHDTRYLGKAGVQSAIDSLGRAARGATGRCP